MAARYQSRDRKGVVRWCSGDLVLEHDCTLADASRWDSTVPYGRAS
ncbi:MAG: hypothetical protein WD557_17310 [Dehalococcoidia bacterium]